MLSPGSIVYMESLSENNKNITETAEYKLV